MPALPERATYWLDAGKRPENYFPVAVLLFATPMVIPHRRFAGFDTIYRVFGLLCLFLPMLVLSHWGHGSYLDLDTKAVEYEVDDGLSLEASAPPISLSATVNNSARRQQQARQTANLPAIRITPYYWFWWLRWCRTFTIHGRVLCADGSPVPGAVVCAYDVDAWWWWWSRPWFDHENLRDDRAEAFTTLLWEGSYRYCYTARATTPGTFTAGPPKAEEMYSPEVFGRGATDRVIVE